MPVGSLAKSSLVIPAYYASEAHMKLTDACLDSLRYGRPDQVILVVDGPPVGSEGHPNVDLYINRPENGGYAAAVNDGWAASTGDIIITSNNDIVFTPGWLDAIVKPLYYGYDISSIRTTDNTGYETEDRITEGDKFGSLWAMRRSTYDCLGPLDTRFGKGYFEDLDYRRRAINAGLRIAKNHGHLVEHTGRGTFDTVDPDRELYGNNIRVFSEKWGFLE